MSHAAYLVAAWLFVVGLYGVVTSRHAVHLIVCLAVAQSSPGMLLLSATHGARDSLAQTLLLFEIVVQTAISALLLALAVAAHARSAELDPRRRPGVRE
jgi:multicomponent Na+:H+ antiporter subunit C